MGVRWEQAATAAAVAGSSGGSVRGLRDAALRGFGGIRTRADPGTDPRRIGLCMSGQEGRAQCDTKVNELCLELGVTKATIYRYVAPDGSLRDRVLQVLGTQPNTHPSLHVVNRSG